MKGSINRIINEIVDKRSKGNETIAGFTQARLALKGINAADYTSQTPDDPTVIAKLVSLAQEWGIEVTV